ncbi:MAG: hypothetical protein RMK89_14565, partial [Armatimonadota bacterium]|nr:hypothetical protein [Armatimonadota bacterium]MDW8144667.1 hypothetical protein [Armatimonadota bacterium]
PTVVRLRPKYPSKRSPRFLRFQSHCGAIATPLKSNFTTLDLTFQSHCGAIATRTPSNYQLYNRLFQSHCGAIATEQEEEQAFETYQSFNPTVVRLRLGGVQSTRTSTTPFQSHCGAIATITIRPEVGVAGQFQSHCGAIATCLTYNTF